MTNMVAESLISEGAYCFRLRLLACLQLRLRLGPPAQAQPQAQAQARLQVQPSGPLEAHRSTTPNARPLDRSLDGRSEMDVISVLQVLNSAGIMRVENILRLTAVDYEELLGLAPEEARAPT